MADYVYLPIVNLPSGQRGFLDARKVACLEVSDHIQKEGWKVVRIHLAGLSSSMNLEFEPDEIEEMDDFIRQIYNGLEGMATN